MATDDKDRLGDKLRDKEKAEEDSYFAERDRAALERLRKRLDPAGAPAAPDRDRRPGGGNDPKR